MEEDVVPKQAAQLATAPRWRETLELSAEMPERNWLDPGNDHCAVHGVNRVNLDSRAIRVKRIFLAGAESPCNYSNQLEINCSYVQGW
jgi:hypothetical protein